MSYKIPGELRPKIRNSVPLIQADESSLIAALENQANPWIQKLGPKHQSRREKRRIVAPNEQGAIQSGGFFRRKRGEKRNLNKP